MSGATINEELTRFTKVMSSRKEINELLGLFCKLKESDKFSEQAKPFCFARLMERCSFRIPDVRLGNLIEVIYASQAASIARSAVPQDELDRAVRPVVARLFKVVSLTPSAVGHLFYFVERSGLSPSQAQTVAYLLESGMDEAEVDKLCDLNWEDLRRFKKAESVNAAAVAA